MTKPAPIHPPVRRQDYLDSVARARAAGQVPYRVSQSSSGDYVVRQSTSKVTARYYADRVDAYWQAIVMNATPSARA